MSDAGTGTEGRVSGGRDASRGSAVRLGAEILSRGLTFAATLLMAHRLSLTDFGSFAAQSGIAAILAEAGDLGLQALLARALVARQFPLADFVRARAILFAALLAPVAVGIALRPVLGVLVLYFLLANWSEFLGVALRARGAAFAEGWLLLGLRLFGLVAVFFALRTPGLFDLAVAFAASTLPAILLGVVLLARARSDETPVASRGPMAVLRTALPLGVNGPLALWSTKVELLLLPWLRGAVEAGLFAGALRLVEPLLAVPAAVAAGALPALTREAIRGGDAARRRTILTVAVLAAPAATGIALTAPSLIGLLGADFAPGAAGLRWLGVAVIPLFINALLLQCLIAAGHAAWVPRLTALRVGVALVLAALLLPRLGATGASLGFLASETLMCWVHSVACRRSGFGVSLGRPVAVGLALAVPMAVATAWGVERQALPWTIAQAVLVFGATVSLAYSFKARIMR